MGIPYLPYNAPSYQPATGPGGNPYAPVPKATGPQQPLPTLPTGIPQAPGAPGYSAGPPGGAPPTGKDVAAQKKRVGPKTADEELLDIIRAFFDEMNAPLDMNDPAVQTILNQMRQDTLQDAGNRGIHGGYSNAMAEQAYARGAAGLAMQKKGMAANALGMYTGAAQNQRDFNYGRQKDDYQAQMDRWKYDQDQNLDLWKLGGGIVGGLAGGLAGIPGGPAGIAAGASAGWGLGSGVGGSLGSSFGSSPPPQWRPSQGGY